MILAQTCNRPDDPANGNVLSLPDRNQLLFNLNDEIWFECDDGFDRNGIEDFFCQSDGTWKPQPFPTCVRRGSSLMVYLALLTITIRPLFSSCGALYLL